MTGFLNMARLDLFTMKGQIKNCLLLGALVIFFGAMGTSLLILCFTGVWFIVLVLSTLFMIQEKNDLLRLYGTLSVGPRDVVLGRYLFMLSIHLLATLLMLLVFSFFTLFRDTQLTAQDTAAGICVSLLVFSFVVGIQTPMYFKLGYTKAKFLSLIPFLAIIAFIGLPIFNPVLEKTITFMENAPGGLLIVGSLLASGGMLYLSYLISISTYRRRGQGSHI